MPTVTQQLADVVRRLQQTAIGVVPQPIGGLVILLTLVLAARLVEWLLRRFLVRIKLDALVQQAGADKTLHRLGMRQSLTRVLPRVVYFLLLLLFARTAADVLGLQAISEAVAALFAYLPNVFAAVLLVIVGGSVSQFAGHTVARAAEEAGIEFARSLGSLVSGLLMFVIGMMAVAQLKIDTDMVRIVTICTLSGVALAFGLSFGLGTRDITRHLMAGFYARKLFRSGDVTGCAARAASSVRSVPHRPSSNTTAARWPSRTPYSSTKPSRARHDPGLSRTAIPATMKVSWQA